jgi:hypothetical protein
MKTIVFAGPSLAEAELRTLTSATRAPPIKRGDLTGTDDYGVIVILDGEFGQSVAVSPKEILAVIDRGKAVIGAASMGALRASELDRCGMIGVGWVYRHFRRQAVRRDADVALVYSVVDFKPMTVAMVDVCYWLEQTFAAGLIGKGERALLLKVARNIFFAERTKDRLMDSFRRAVGDRMLQSLLAYTGGGVPSVKSLDAEEALRLSVSYAKGRMGNWTATPASRPVGG